jgi:hypothetical protein
MFAKDELNRTPLKEYNLIVTATNWTTTRAIGIPYQTIDGVWRLRYNVVGTLSSPSASFSLIVQGISFPTAINQMCSGGQFTDNTTSLIRSWASGGSSSLSIYLSSTASSFAWSGDVELASKPSFVE